MFLEKTKGFSFAVPNVAGRWCSVEVNNDVAGSPQSNSIRVRSVCCHSHKLLSMHQVANSWHVNTSFLFRAL